MDPGSGRHWGRSPKMVIFGRFFVKKTSFFHGKMSFSIFIKEKACFLQTQVGSRAGPARLRSTFRPGDAGPGLQGHFGHETAREGTIWSISGTVLHRISSRSFLDMSRRLGSDFFRRFFEGGMSKILGGGLSGGKMGKSDVDGQLLVPKSNFWSPGHWQGSGRPLAGFWQASGGPGGPPPPPAPPCARSALSRFAGCMTSLYLPVNIQLAVH